MTTGSEPLQFTSLVFWNYNKSPEDASRGVKRVNIFADGKKLSPPGGFLIRKAPGFCWYDFGHEIHPMQETKCFVSGDESIALAWINNMENPVEAQKAISCSEARDDHNNMVKQVCLLHCCGLSKVCGQIS